MKIQEQDLYHGAALTQIVQHPSFKALNRGSSKFGHYLVNTDRHLFVKYRTHNESPWQHTFSVEDTKALAAALASDDKVWLCLVCGHHTICALDKSEIVAVLNPSLKSQPWVTVEVPSGASCRVRGSAGSLNHTVAHNSFPGKLFA